MKQRTHNDKTKKNMKKCNYTKPFLLYIFSYFICFFFTFVDISKRIRLLLISYYSIHYHIRVLIYNYNKKIYAYTFIKISLSFCEYFYIVHVCSRKKK